MTFNVVLCLTKFDADLKKKFCECVSSGIRLSQAAKICGVSRRNIYYHLANDPEFKEAYEDAEETATDNVEAALYAAATGGDVKAQQIWLFNKRKNVWADSKNIKLDANVAATMEYTLQWSDQHQK